MFNSVTGKRIVTQLNRDGVLYCNVILDIDDDTLGKILTGKYNVLFCIRNALHKIEPPYKFKPNEEQNIYFGRVADQEKVQCILDEIVL
jgi:hypothetical protein